MRAAENQVAQVAPPEIGFGKPPPQEEGFAAATEKVTGKSKETINRAIRRATEVCQEARDLIRGTALDTGSYLDSIAKRNMTDAEQVQHVRDALEGLTDRDRHESNHRDPGDLLLTQKACADHRNVGHVVDVTAATDAISNRSSPKLRRAVALSPDIRAATGTGWSRVSNSAPKMKG